MAGFRLTDYFVCGIGVLGALHAAGLLGMRLPVLRAIAFFASLIITAYVGAVLALNFFVDYLPPARRRIYLAYAAANALPAVVVLIQHFA